MNQTSVDLLRSWRGNCDVQIIVYNCDPKKPNVGEIARVTDYIVAYSCKGNSTISEEREQMKKLISRYVVYCYCCVLKIFQVQGNTFASVMLFIHV